MKNDNLLFQILFPVLILLGLCLFCGCNQYPAQKKPWPKGTHPVYFHGIKIDYTPPLTVDSMYFDDFDLYDGSYHYFYFVHDSLGKKFKGVIDYQLSLKK